MQPIRLPAIWKNIALPLGAVAVFVIFVCLSSPLAWAENRPDIVVLGKVNAFGSPQKAPVLFLHDRHTGASAPRMGECTTCHSMGEKGFLNFAYTGASSTGEALEGKRLMAAWHQSCGGCHAALSKAGEVAGPLSTDMCARCHTPSPNFESVRVSGRMDDDTHTTHILSDAISGPGGDENCMVCHHAVKDVGGKPVAWESGGEIGCAECHTASSPVTLRDASHKSCLSCHGTVKIDTGVPLLCADCHGS